MKPGIVLLLAAALGGVTYVALRTEAPTYTPPTIVAPDALPTALLEEPQAGEVVRVFDVEGMCCGGCAPKIYKALAAAPGVRAAAVDFDSATARAIVKADVDVASLESSMTFDDYVAKSRP
jgi:copper chaperone CopZ